MSGPATRDHLILHPQFGRGTLAVERAGLHHFFLPEGGGHHLVTADAETIKRWTNARADADEENR